VNFAGVPGVVEQKVDRGETTLVVDPARLPEASLHLRDELGFNFLSDVSSVDYLGWSDEPVAGYWGSARAPQVSTSVRRPSPSGSR
jgi:NADH:ubiquinone oxidoreductase subunit C